MTAKPSVFILGGTGMLGHRLANGLIDLGYRVTVGLRQHPDQETSIATMPAFSKSARVLDGVDAYDYRGVCKLVDDVGADVVLNCIGAIKQKAEGQSSVSCIALNAILPHALMEVVSKRRKLLIHFSTDCVFKGDAGGYREDDAPDAQDWYGRTKALGEVAGPDVLTLRTSIIGPEISTRSSLVEWYLSHASQTIKGFDRAIYSGITTREMVHVIDHVLYKKPSMRGLYQVASLPISKFDLLIKLRNALGLATEIVRDVDVVIDRSLAGQRFANEAGYAVPSWDDMVADLADDLRTYWHNGWSRRPPEHAFSVAKSLKGSAS